VCSSDLGEQGKGINSRWYTQTLARRIINIERVSDRIEFIHGDGITIIRKYVEHPDVVFFIDPPYTAAGKKAGTRLYTHNALAHEELFSLVETLHGNFLMTYDNTEGVRSMAERHGFEIVEIPMKNTHHANMSELLIGKNLNWVRAKVSLF
jgi:DNA adenine methylase